jgi:leader peptidase (prepilin peptidase)/N-methyltransferase
MSWRGRAASGSRRIVPWAEREVVKYISLAAVASAMMIASVAATPGRAGYFGAALALLMVAIAVVDAGHFIIPNGLTLVAFLLALANAARGDGQEISESIASVLVRGAALGLAFLGLREIYRRWRGREGIGLGDVKLAAVAGAWLDWTLAPVAIEIAALSALAVYGARQLIMRHSLCATARLPFGLFFAPAIWLCWLIDARVFES